MQGQAAYSRPGFLSYFLNKQVLSFLTPFIPHTFSKKFTSFRVNMQHNERRNPAKEKIDRFKYELLAISMKGIENQKRVSLKVANKLLACFKNDENVQTTRNLSDVG